MKRLFYWLIPICGFLFAACEEEERMDQEDFIAAVRGCYMERTVFHGLESLDEGWQEMDELPSGIPLGYLPVLWFVDRDTVLVRAMFCNETQSAMPDDNSLSTRWSRYLLKQGKDLSLFVKYSFNYDPLTGRFSLDNLSNEIDEGECYIENVLGKEIVMRIELKEPVTRDIAGYRNVYQEQLSPDLHPNSPYKVFNSNEEAIAYVKEVLGE